MTQLICPECGKIFNETVHACPNCGCPANDCSVHLDDNRTEKKLDRISLLPGETVVASAEFNIIPFIILCSALAIISIILINVFDSNGIYNAGLAISLISMLIISTLSAVLVASTSWAMYFVITNKRVIAYYGLLIWVSFELKIEKVESITIYQGLFGRIFKCGRVRVCGVGASKVMVPFIKRPFEFRQHFFDIQYSNQNSKL